MSDSPPPRAPSGLAPVAQRWAFAALFFFAGTDRVFLARVFGVGLRLGHLLLLAAVVAALARSPRILRELREDRRLAAAALAWAAFLATYALAALLGASPALSLLKAGWAVFNIGGAALVLLAAGAPRERVEEGLAIATVVPAAMIVGDALLVHVLFADGDPLREPGGLAVPVALGYAQTGLEFEGRMLLRPHALFYEPSYAGAALAFASMLLLAAGGERPRRAFAGAAGLALAAVVLTSGRTGLFSITVGLGLAVALALRGRRWDALRHLGLAAALAAVLLGAFFATPGGARYGRFLTGPLGPAGIVQRLHVGRRIDRAAAYLRGLPPPVYPDDEVGKGSSENMRIADIGAALQRVKDHPVLGDGVEAQPGSAERVLRPATTNTWAEIASESGLLGLAAFLAALGLTLRAGRGRAGGGRARLFVLAGVGAHLLVNLNFTQTFPRLDYWMLFFAAACLLPRAPPKGAAAPDSAATTG